MPYTQYSGTDSLVNLKIYNETPIQKPTQKGGDYAWGFHKTKTLNEKQPYETPIQKPTQQGHDYFMQVTYDQIIK